MTHRIKRHGHAAVAALLASSALALCPSRAEAHGGFPRAFSIFFEPNKPEHMLFRSDVWGLFRSTDAGKTWLWSCAELYRANSLNADHRNMTVLTGGRVLVASSFNGLYISDDPCTWHASPAFSTALPDGGTFSELVQDVQQKGSELRLLTATGNNGKINGKIWKSTDRGDTWTVIGGPLPDDFAGSSLGVPPSGAPDRLYASGRHVDADGTVVRSDDGGMTWKAYPVPTQLPSAVVRIALIHPTNPDIFFVWADQPEGLGANEPDEIYGTKDGGKTFILLHASMGDLPGLALSPDNSEVLIAGPLDDIIAAKVDDALANGAKAFSPRSTSCGAMPCGYWGLAWTAQGLYAGTNDFSVTPPRFTFGVSKDGGKTFSSLMGVCDVKFDTSCGAGTTMAQACQNVWDTGYAYDYINTDRCMPGAAGAAGAAGATGAGGATTGAGGTTAPQGTGGAGTGNVATGSGATSTNGGQAGTNGNPSGGGGSSGGGGGGSRTSGGCSYSPAAEHSASGLLALALGALGLRARRRKR
jgi:MYXO-CTERM domain-containing protein